eukprot:gene31247-6391_t
METNIGKREVAAGAAGEGAFATVEKCMYTPQTGEAKVVAVKKLKPGVIQNPTCVQRFYDEVRLLRKLDHPNIMRYIGIGCIEASTEKKQQETMFLACEVMQGGTLNRLVMSQMLMPHKSLYTLVTALKWCINMADALAYLHSSQTSVIHQDLKLENILLKKIVHPSKPKTANVASTSQLSPADYDMGAEAMMERMDPYSSAGSLQRRAHGMLDALERSVRDGGCNFSSSTRGGNAFFSASVHGGKTYFKAENLPVRKALLSSKTGSLMYISPEMYCNENNYTEKVDVFSFGVCMYELLHKYCMAYAIIGNNSAREEIERYAQNVSEGYRPPIHKHLPDDLKLLIADCWAQDPKERPAMIQVVERLRAIQDEGLLVAMGRGNKEGCCVVC